MSDPLGFWIRTLQESDVQALLEIERKCFPDPWPASWFRQPIRAKDYCWGACNETRMLGYAFACREDELLHLANLAVHPEYRCHGIATALVEQVLKTAHDCSFAEVYLEVRNTNIEAIRLYERFGFKVSHVEENYYQGHEDALIMKVTINGLV